MGLAAAGKERPQHVVTDFLRAIASGDAKELESTVSEEVQLLRSAEELMKDLQANLLRELEKGVGIAQDDRFQEDGSAIVLVLLDVPQNEIMIVDEPQPFPAYVIRCVQEGGRWKVDPRQQVDYYDGEDARYLARRECDMSRTLKVQDIRLRLVEIYQNTKDEQPLTAMLKWLHENYEAMDEEAQRLTDYIFENLIRRAGETIEQLPDSLLKRQAERIYAVSQRSHYNVKLLLEALENPPVELSEIAVEATDRVQAILQFSADLLYDQMKAKQKREREIVQFALLLGGIDELMSAVHLMRHGYYNQANAHMRTVLEILDKVRLFYDQPQRIDEWASADIRVLLREFSPSAVRIKLGKEKFDPVYDFLGEHGIHITFRWFQDRAFVELPDEGKDARRTAVLTVGGSRYEHLLVMTSSFLMYVSVKLLLEVVYIGEGSIDPDEANSFLENAVESLFEFTENHFVEWAARHGFDIGPIRMGIQEMRDQIRSSEVG